MAGLRRALERSWYGQSPAVALRPLGMAFKWLVQGRRWAYRRGILSSGHPGVPVIVVGNLSVGGTGKTPLVLWLVQRLQAEGLRVGVVTRGHGARSVQRRPRLVSPEDGADEVGDESLLLARRAECPVCVGVDRLAAARLLAAEGCKVIIADDGLQHYALRRDLEIAVVDSGRGLGNGALLPAGPLREPAARLGAVDAIVMNGQPSPKLPTELAAGEKRVSMVLHPLQFVNLASRQSQSLAHWRGKTVHAVAGIGNPARFFATLRSLGIDPVEHPFADHHRFAPAELAFDDARDIVMTEKDAVKCAPFAADRMWYLKVAAHFESGDAARLLGRVRERILGT